MPALRPRLRRSARLQIQSQIISPRRCKTGLKFMEPPPAPPARGKGKRGRGGKDRATTSPTISISWQAVPQWTNRLVDYLVGHPPDCRILFASEKKNPANCEAEGCPSGKDKNEIHAVIARVISLMILNMWCSTPRIPTNFGTLYIIASWHNLRTKFRDIRAEFESMGAGIVPIDSETSYDQLYSIWGSHPSFSAKTSSSKPGVDHTSDLFSLTRPLGGSLRPPASSSTDPGSPMQLGNTPLPNAPAGGVAGLSTGPTYDYLPPNAHAGGATAAAPPTSPQFYHTPPAPNAHAGGAAAAAPPTSPFCHTPPAPGGSGGSPSQWNYVPPPPSTHTNSSAGSPVFRYPPLPSGATSHDGTYSPVAHSPTDDYNFDGIYDDNPLAGEMEDLNMDSLDEITHDDSNTISLDSLPRRRAGKKRQEPPSPPPLLLPLIRNRCPPTLPSSMVALVVALSKAIIISRAVIATVLPNSANICLDDASKFSLQTSPDGDSIHSDKLTLYQLKNKRLMVKLNASRQDKEHHLMREEHMDERADAAIVHQRMKEAKEVDIRLREADAAAFALEADVLRLWIQWAQLNAQGGKPAGT
ncbi:uncharacterized protein F5891DRAFT_1183300 [Suillus fuscotomentosus]|uniref:Uncharacterized protein n=1 Tax=Suillus fuscotomentosus TaxID=1912939 RepID=A0AAD4HPJ5_9AGAM|nr:uncharacterized protein F5891DRAFT_1183300 [Suillus fuscotomentosus]KAG1905355.1 hypothetical protein F5891DRAFT_1183300 [Suillus fuscotomentosus]